MAGKLRPAILENVKLIFRNFAGAEGKYNAAGDRNTGVLLSPEIAEAMRADGWNVKQLKPREVDGEVQEGDFWIEVAIKFKGYNPAKVVLVSGKSKTTLTEELAQLADVADIANVDLTLNPYEWDVNGNQGVKAYLGNCFITLNENELDRKYSDLEEKQESIKTTGPRFQD
jgi:hypothetical protein